MQLAVSLSCGWNPPCYCFGTGPWKGPGNQETGSPSAGNRLHLDIRTKAINKRNWRQAVQFFRVVETEKGQINEDNGIVFSGMCYYNLSERVLISSVLYLCLCLRGKEFYMAWSKLKRLIRSDTRQHAI